MPQRSRETEERYRDNLDRIIGCHPSVFLSTSQAARCVACHGVLSHAEHVAPVGECSIPVVEKVARQPRSSYRVS